MTPSNMNHSQIAIKYTNNNQIKKKLFTLTTHSHSMQLEMCKWKKHRFLAIFFRFRSFRSFLFWNFGIKTFSALKIHFDTNVRHFHYFARLTTGRYWEPAVLIEGVLFRARYLGSTQLVCEGQPTKSTRMMQAEEAVSRIKVICPWQFHRIQWLNCTLCVAAST